MESNAPASTTSPTANPVHELQRSLDALASANNSVATLAACRAAEQALPDVQQVANPDFDLLCIALRKVLLVRTNEDATLTCVEVARALFVRGGLTQCRRPPAAVLMRPLAKALRGADAQMQFVALSALRSLCAHPDHRSRFTADPDCVREVVNVMRRYEQMASAQSTALATLFGIVPRHNAANEPCLHHDEASALATGGAARAALRAARIHSRRACVIALALRALSRLCAASSASARGVLGGAGLSRLAVDALVRHERDRDTVLAAVATLSALNNGAAIGPVAPRAVVAAMCNFRAERAIHKSALAVLLSVAQIDHNRAASIAAIGAPQLVLSSMIQYADDSTMLLECLQFLLRLANVVGCARLDVKLDHMRRTVSGAVRLHLEDAKLMDAAAELLKLSKA